MSPAAGGVPGARRKRQALLACGALTLLGCAAPAPVGTSGLTTTETPALALLLATDAYELHLRDGTIFVLRDGAARPLASYDELHALYRRAGEPLVPAMPVGETTSVLGWRDLDCVRAAQTCGREPDRPARDMIRLRLRF
jgi:hypothetical protein